MLHALLLSLHFAAAGLNPAILRDRAVLCALRTIGNEIVIQMACERVDAQTALEEARGWQ